MTTREKILRDNGLLPLYLLLKRKGGVASEDETVRTRPDGNCACRGGG